MPQKVFVEISELSAPLKPRGGFSRKYISLLPIPLELEAERHFRKSHSLKIINDTQAP
jgi:hypothetical protein